MDDQISSTTPSHDVHHDDEGEFRAEKQANSLLDEDFSSREAQARVPEVEGILDLVGGAKDALERHRSTMPRTEEPLLDFGEPEPSSTFKPEPEAPKPEPEAPKPETEAPKPETESPKPAPISSSGDASPKQAKPEEKATKRLSLADLLYWRDLQRTGVVFGTGVVLLLSLKQCSIISVISYVALALLSVTISFRIYKGILQAVQKSEDGHPFKMYLDKDTAIPAEMVHKYSDSALVHINHVIKELRRIFLVEDLVDSLKFAVLMWVLTYIGAWFNGLTLILSGFIGAFCCPVIYEKNQAQLDPYIKYLDKQFKETVAKIMALIPGVKPKTE